MCIHEKYFTISFLACHYDILLRTRFNKRKIRTITQFCQFQRPLDTNFTNRNQAKPYAGLQRYFLLQ